MFKNILTTSSKRAIFKIKSTSNSSILLKNKKYSTIPSTSSSSSSIPTSCSFSPNLNLTSSIITSLISNKKIIKTSALIISSSILFLSNTYCDNNKIEDKEIHYNNNNNEENNNNNQIKLSLFKKIILIFKYYFKIFQRSLWLTLAYLPALLTSPILLIPLSSSSSLSSSFVSTCSPEETENSILNADKVPPLHWMHQLWWDLLKNCIRISGVCSIKLAQWIATRPDLFPLSLCVQFQELQSSLTNLPSFEEIEPLIKNLYGENYEDYITFYRDKSTDKPVVIGGGCIAQVLLGKFTKKSSKRENFISSNNHDLEETSNYDEDLAIKIVHPNVKENIQIDLDLMKFVTNTMESIFPFMKNYLDLHEVVDEFSSLLLNQVNMKVEGENLKQFRLHFNIKKYNIIDHFFQKLFGKKNVYQVNFPLPFLNYSNEDILVESYEKGYLIRDYIKYCDQDKKKELAKIGLNAIFKMIFLDNFIHADLHPGNIIYNPNKEEDVLTLIDAGIVVSLQPIDRKNLVDLFKAVIMNDGEQVGRLIIERARDSRKVINPKEFERSMGELVSHVFHNGLCLSALGVTEILQKTLLLCYKHNVKLETRFASVCIAMGIAEGLGRELDPEVDVLMRAAPYVMRASIEKII